MSRVDEVNEFFIHDMNIKKAMMDMVPDPYYLLDKEYIASYVDKAYDDLKYILDEFRDIIKLRYDNYISEDVEKKFKQIMDEFVLCGYDGFKLNEFYTNRISDMRPTFLTKVSQCNCAYYLFRDPAYPIRESKSINELLHSMHSDLINNDNLYRHNEALDKANVGEQMEVTLYGDDNPFGRAVFSAVSANEIDELDETMVFSINDNKVLVMTRGLGHATSIEFDRTTKGDVRVAYYIPKICDVNMVNSLKGISKIKPNTPIFSGASGIFYTTESELLSDVFGLLSGIPTDRDLIKDPTRVERGAHA
jgi:hypothetical protein